MFQTNLCGVEAQTVGYRCYNCVQFQTNLCGVEAQRQREEEQQTTGFQTNLCGVEASSSHIPSMPPTPVSDEPLWG